MSQGSMQCPSQEVINFRTYQDRVMDDGTASDCDIESFVEIWLEDVIDLLNVEIKKGMGGLKLNKYKKYVTCLKCVKEYITDGDVVHLSYET